MSKEIVGQRNRSQIPERRPFQDRGLLPLLRTGALSNSHEILKSHYSFEGIINPTEEWCPVPAFPKVGLPGGAKGTIMLAISRSHVIIDCLLSVGCENLVGDGCIYENSFPSGRLTSPAKLKRGDYVKLRLWLPEEKPCIFIDLAEILWIRDHWLEAELITVRTLDQLRIERFLALQGLHTRQSPTFKGRILIRA